MRAMILSYKKKTLKNIPDSRNLIITFPIFTMASPFCRQTGRAHSEYVGLLHKCPHCKDSIAEPAQKEHSHRSESTLSFPSTASSIIDLESDQPAMPTPLPRFPTFQPYSAEVESHRQTAIRSVPKSNKRQPNHAGSPALSIQTKASKTVPIPENVKIVVIKGIAGAPRSFTTLGK